MNVLLVDDDDYTAKGRAVVTGRRARHIVEILKSREGQILRAGQVGGRLGRATVTRTRPGSVEVELELTEEPPPPLPLALVIALPRPKVVRRLLRGLTTLGVKHIVLVRAARVERAYFQSPILSPERIDAELRLGLEQAVDTILPTVSIEPRFRPFLEDRLPTFAEGGHRVVVHPTAREPLVPGPTEQTTLAIGPEGGWVDFELDLLGRAGFAPAHLGPRTLATEVAAVSAASRFSHRSRK